MHFFLCNLSIFNIPPWNWKILTIARYFSPFYILGFRFDNPRAVDKRDWNDKGVFSELVDNANLKNDKKKMTEKKFILDVFFSLRKWIDQYLTFLIMKLKISTVVLFHRVLSMTRLRFRVSFWMLGYFA